MHLDRYEDGGFIALMKFLAGFIGISLALIVATGKTPLQLTEDAFQALTPSTSVQDSGWMNDPVIAQVIPAAPIEPCDNPPSKVDTYDYGFPGDLCEIDDMPYDPTFTVAHPAGNQQVPGLKPRGTSLNDNPSTRNWNHGKTYACTTGHEQTITYGGNDIIIDGVSVGLLGDAEFYPIDHQPGVTLYLTGGYSYLLGLRDRLQSIVVITADTRSGVHHDDQAVDTTVTPLPEYDGIEMSTSEFVGNDEAGTGYIKKVKLCLTAP